MPTIRKLKSGRVNVQVRREGHPPLSATFATATEAKAWARKIEGDIDTGKHFGLSKIKRLCDAIDRFIKHPTDIKTTDDRTSRLNWWKEHYGDVKLARFGPDVIAEARDRLTTENIESDPKKPERHRAPQTVRHYLMALSACLDYAKRELRWIGANPVSEVTVPSVSPARIRWLTDEQRKALIDACGKSGNPDLELVVRLALSSGARLGEIVGLRWPWIDLDAGCAHLPVTKNGEPRVMPIVGKAAEMLKARSKVRNIRHDLVFPAPDDPSQPRNVRQAWAVARKRAGLGDFRFHDLRHDAATQMLRAHVDSRIVATVLGHRSMNMMRRYAHVVPDTVVDAARKVVEK